MKNILLIMKKELKGYFHSLVAYLVLFTFLSVSAWLFMESFFLIDQASMRDYFSMMPWMFLFFIPALTMRSWAEERKMGTIEYLLTKPISEWELVLGKFLATTFFVCSAIFLSFPVLITVLRLGSPDIGVIIGSYLGILFMAASMIALGLFFSSLCENQIVAFILELLSFFMLIIVGQGFFLFKIPNSMDWLVSFFRHLSLSSHLESISRGVIDSRDILYYFLLILFGLYLNVKSLQSRRVQ